MIQRPGTTPLGVAEEQDERQPRRFLGADIARGTPMLFLVSILVSAIAAVAAFELQIRDREADLITLAAGSARIVELRLGLTPALARVPRHPEAMGNGYSPEFAEPRSRVNARGPLPESANPVSSSSRDASSTLNSAGATLAQDLSSAPLERVRHVLLLDGLDMAWELTPGSRKDMSAIDAAQFRMACSSDFAGRVVEAGGALAVCSLLSSAAGYLLAIVDPLEMRQPALGSALIVFLGAASLFLLGLGFAHRALDARNLDQASLRDALRQVIARRKEAILLLQRESDEHLDARRMATYGRWSTRFKAGEYFWFEVDDEVARIYGVSRQKLLGASADLLQQIHPDDRSRVNAEYRRVNAELCWYSLQYRLVRPDGDVREVLEVGEPLLGAEGQLLGFHGIAQDLTGRQNTAAASVGRVP